MDTLSIVLVVIGAVVIFVIAVYNGLVTARNQTKNAWSDIDVQLKRRYDLIPNLVNTVKGYATHEKETFEKVTQARANAISATTVAGQAQAENMLQGALKSLFAVAESYPELKANTNFLELQRELSDTENKIQAARRFYNSMVQNFNTKTEVFPNNLIVGLFNFEKFDFFELDNPEEERKNVKVEF
jgi:LemA protein